MSDFHITIDLDKKCAECGKGGAVPSGICLKCTTKAAYSEKPLKSWQAKAVRQRMEKRRDTTVAAYCGTTGEMMTTGQELSRSIDGTRGDAFRAELASLLNRYSMENASNTPDYMLADYLIECLKALATTIQQRETWHGRDARPSQITVDDLKA